MKSLPSLRSVAYLRSLFADEGPFILVFSFFFFSLIFWVYLDQTVPIWDSAAHLLQGYDLRDMLSSQASIDKKIFALLTCANRYPPLFCWVHCFFLVSRIPCAVADQLPRFVFYAIGLISLYKLGRQLFNDASIALIATALFFALPIVCVVSHTRGVIDMPLASMCFLALWLIARWNTAPSLANSLMAGFAIGLACLTKQMGAIYLAPAICLVMLQRLLARDFSKAFQFSIGLGLAAILYLVWLVPSLPEITRSMHQWDQVLASQAGDLPDWFSNLASRTNNTILSISVPVSIFFVLSLFNFPAQRKLWLPASTILGLFVLCTLRWCGNEARYVLPVLGYLALSTAALLVRMWRSGWPLLRALDAAFGLYLLILYFVFNFTPYPFSIGSELRRNLDNKLHGFYSQYPGVYDSHPQPSGPMAYNWLLSQIQSNRLNHQPILMISVNSRKCELESIRYLAKQRELPLELKLMFVSPLGEFFTCNSTDVDLNPDWYVTIKDDPDSEMKHFLTDRDRANYNDLKRYFEESGRFLKAGEFRFSGKDARMLLYRKSDSQGCLLKRSDLN